ncbi:unnamed protein product [Calicophoron daubneyi]|uniref:Uncharacterized protein n=1 Tax=Calicophoron daubneyi TaxID=300641 RepID=A0AAV2T344_CALDB
MAGCFHVIHSDEYSCWSIDIQIVPPLLIHCANQAGRTDSRPNSPKPEEHLTTSGGLSKEGILFLLEEAVHKLRQATTEIENKTVQPYLSQQKFLLFGQVMKW